MKRAIAGLGLALGLAACAGTPPWTKDGVSPQQAAADYADCRSQAQVATRRSANIEADIMASRRLDWEQTGTLATREQLFANETADRTDALVKSCMIAKGYAPGE